MRGQTMVGYQFEHDFSNGLTFRQNARYAHVDVNINSYIGAGYVGPPANATLQRYRFVTNDSADLGTIDNQLEGRFNTGAISHKVLAGVDYKKYRLDDYQASAFPAGSAEYLQPGIRFLYADGRSLSQPHPGPATDRCLPAGSDEARPFHIGSQRP